MTATASQVLSKHFRVKFIDVISAGPVVDDQVLGVVFHDRVVVGNDRGARLFETLPELLEFLLAALDAGGDEHLHVDAAIDRGGELAEDRLVGAAEERHGDPRLGAMNGVEEDFPSGSWRGDDAIG